MDLPFELLAGSDGEGDVVLDFTNLKPIARMVKPRVHLQPDEARRLAKQITESADAADLERLSKKAAS